MSVDSIDKIIEYVSRVSKVPIVVEDHVVLARPVEKVTISESFFLTDGCQMCGRCCPNENTAYTQTRWNFVQGYCQLIDEGFAPRYGVAQEMKKLLLNSQKKKIRVNGKLFDFYSHPKDTHSACFKVDYEDRGVVDRCHWLHEKDGLYLCKIHPIRSITCGLPHIRFYYHSERSQTNVGTAQFGRNWALRCPVVFRSYEEEAVLSKIEWLQALEDAAKDLEIETYLPEILAYLINGGRSSKSFKLMKERKLF